LQEQAEWKITEDVRVRQPPTTKTNYKKPDRWGPDEQLRAWVRDQGGRNGPPPFQVAEAQLRAWERDNDLVNRLKVLWDNDEDWKKKLMGSQFRNIGSEEAQMKVLEQDWEISDKHHRKGNMTLDFLSNNVVFDGNRVDRKKACISWFGWDCFPDDKCFHGHVETNICGDIKMSVCEYAHVTDNGESRVIEELRFTAFPKKATTKCNEKKKNGKRPSFKITPRNVAAKKGLFS